MVSRSFVLKSMALSVIVILGTTAFILIRNNQKNPEPPIDDNEEKPTIFSLDTNLGINGSEYFKGQQIHGLMNINITGLDALLHFLDIGVKTDTRDAWQRIKLNRTLQPAINNGTKNHTLPISIGPGFPLKGFISLNIGVYTLTGYNLSYSQNGTEYYIVGTIDHQITINDWPEVDQIPSRHWNVTSLNASVLISQGNRSEIQLNSTNQSGSIFMITTVNTTGHTSIDYNIHGLESSKISISLNSTSIYSKGTNGSLYIGSLTGNYTLIINATLNLENVTIKLNMRSKHNSIFVVNANNYWDGLATDGLFFEEPRFYLDQVSSRYHSIFNITFHEVAKVDFSSKSGTNLFTMIQEAKSQVGTALKLVNNTWNTATGPHPGNQGADVLLVFTNKTMDHLGIVIGAEGEVFNIAVNARGSNFEGNYRLISTMADNLLQHEISHIFGAPDRWTETDKASIMTKSRPDDAYLDILFGRFWLLRTNWLEQDIQLMSTTSKLFLS